MKHLKALLIGLSLITMTACSDVSIPEEGPYVIDETRGHGDLMTRRYEHFKALNDAGIMIEVDSHLSSAGSFVLFFDNICLHEHVWVNFHGPMSKAAAGVFALVGVPLIGHGYSEAERDRINNLIAKRFDEHYRPLGTYYLENMSQLYAIRYKGLSAVALNKHFGVPLCPPKT